jgi:hypothetical protein
MAALPTFASWLRERPLQRPLIADAEKERARRVAGLKLRSPWGQIVSAWLRFLSLRHQLGQGESKTRGGAPTRLRPRDSPGSFPFGSSRAREWTVRRASRRSANGCALGPQPASRSLLTGRRAFHSRECKAGSISCEKPQLIPMAGEIASSARDGWPRRWRMARLGPGSPSPAPLFGAPAGDDILVVTPGARSAGSGSITTTSPAVHDRSPAKAVDFRSAAVAGVSPAGPR